MNTDASAYLLIAHGSPDPRHQEAVHHLVDLVRDSLRSSWVVGEDPLTGAIDIPPSPAVGGLPPLVGAAFLELTPIPLTEQMRQFSVQAHTKGYQGIQLLPLFLLPGVHVVEDIPKAVVETQQSFDLPFELAPCPYLGSHPKLGSVLQEAWKDYFNHPRILLCHGSFQPGVKLRIQQLASELDATPAYWIMGPGLEDNLRQLSLQGVSAVNILPYFLFAGRTTDAIAQQIDQLALKFPNMMIQLAPPLDLSPALVKLMVDLLTQQPI